MNEKIQNRPAVSIVVAVRNGETTIADTLESIIKQDYKQIECIVVDGLSSDNTISIVNSFKKQFGNRLKVISEKDNGIYDAMNKGIKMATGDIIAILNSDDFYNSPKSVSTFVEQLTANKVECVYSDVAFVKPNNIHKVVRYYSSKIHRHWMFRFGFQPAHPTFFTYKRNFDKFGYYKPELKNAADFELMLRFLYANHLSFKYIPGAYITMRTGGASTVTKENFRRVNNEILQSCRINKIKTCRIMIMMRYIIKSAQFIVHK